MQEVALLGACMLAWGLATFGMKVAGSRLDPFSVFACNLIGYVAIGAFLVPRAALRVTVHHAVGVAIGITFVLGNLAFYKLAQTEHVSTLVPLTQLFVLIPVTLGVVLLHEPMTSRKLTGICLSVAAIYLLSTGEG
jgi:drug/metabolite transporter (DMT)-like permease